MNTAEDLEFSCAKVQLFNEHVSVDAYTREEAKMCTRSICNYCRHFDQQWNSSLENTGYMISHLKSTTRSTAPSGAIFLGHLAKVKTLRIDYGLVGNLSRCLQLDDGEPSLELLPKRRALTISGSGDADNAFTSFIDARQNAGQPVTLARSQVTSDSPSSSAPVITSGSNEAWNVLDY